MSFFAHGIPKCVCRTPMDIDRTADRMSKKSFISMKMSWEIDIQYRRMIVISNESSKVDSISET